MHARIFVAVGALLTATSSLFTIPAASASDPQQKFVVVLDANAGDPEAAAGHAKALTGGNITHVYKSAFRGYAVTATARAAKKLAGTPGIAFIAPDTFLSAAGQSAFPPPPYEIAQILTRSIRRIDGDASSTKSGNGKGSVAVNVAVLDTGVGPHNDLNVVGGVDCTSGRGFDDQEGHGTIVGGLIGALDNTIDIAGVAPGARIWSARVLSKQLSGSLSQVLCGLDWATSTRSDADHSNDIAVANMSLGQKGNDDGNCGRSSHDALHVAVCAATAAGVTVVAAAGNASTDLQLFVPAAYPEVLTATALADTDGLPGAAGPATLGDCGGSDGDDRPATFSNFATTAADSAHTVAAPGYCVSSLFPGPSVAVSSGTSFAAPHTTGVVALCIASGPCAGLTPAEIVRKIVADATAFSQIHPEYGFVGDLNHPIAGRNYGPLVRAGLY